MKPIFSYNKNKVFDISHIGRLFMFQQEKGVGVVVWPTRSVLPMPIWGKYLVLNQNTYICFPISFTLDILLSLSDHSVEIRIFPFTFFKYW